MAYSYVWPPSLPQAPLKGFTETGGMLILRTPTDSGPAKQRRRGESPSNLQATFTLTSAQAATFEDFVKNTIRGTARFGFKHPRTYNIVEVRIVPQGQGQLYSLAYLAPGYWNLSLQLEILP